MLIIASKVLIIFLYIAVGFAANKFKILGTDSLKHLISLVLNITAPCLLVTSICKQQVTASTLTDTISTLLFSLILFIVFGFITLKISRCLKNINTDDQNVLSVAMVTCNSGFMGFPVASAVFGPVIFYYTVIQNVAFNLYLFTGALIQLNLGNDNSSRKFDKKVNLKVLLSPLKSLVTVVSFISVFFLFAGIRIPKYPMELMTNIANITIPLSMIIVGIQLGDCKIKELFSNINLIISSFVCLILIPALSLVLLSFVPISSTVKLTIVLSFTYPSAVLGVAIASGENKNTKLMAEAVALSTMLSMITLPVWIMILSKIYL